MEIEGLEARLQEAKRVRDSLENVIPDPDDEAKEDEEEPEPSP